MRWRIQNVWRGIVVGLMLACLAGGCSRIPRDQAAFQGAEQRNTAPGYQRFLQSYPDSPLAPEAKKRAAQLEEEQMLSQFKEVEKATKASTIEGWLKYHPQPKVTLMGRLRIAEIDYSDIEKQNPFRPSRHGNSSWDAFVNYYAFGEYLPMPDDPPMRDAYYKKLHPLLVQALGQMKSIPAWSQYLTRFPNSPYVKQTTDAMEKFIIAGLDKWDGYDTLMAYLALHEKALKRPCPDRDALLRQAQDKLAAAVEHENTLVGYDRYLQTFPASSHEQKITLLRDHIRFREARERKNRPALEKLIEQYKGSAESVAKADVADATAYLERVDFDAAVSANTPKAFRDFKEQYKGGRDFANLFGDADARIKRIHNQMLLQAKTKGTSAAFRDFLEIFPESASKSDVLKWQEEAEFKEVIAGSDRDKIRAVNNRYPSSPFRERALNRIDDLDYKDAETQALSEPTTAPLKSYLAHRPPGRRAGEAEALMKKLNQEHAAYVAELSKAREAGSLSRFKKWIIDNQGNQYCVKMGPRDVEMLQREISAKQLVADLTTTAPQTGRTVFPAVPARDIGNAARAVAYVEGVGTSTGFLFTRDGLILTNARVLAKAEAGRLKAKVGARANSARVIATAPAPADLAVVRIEGTYDPVEPILMGNPTLLAAGEKVVCLYNQGTKVETIEGTFHSAKTAGQIQWLLIQSAKVNPNLGGVIVNQKARAMGLVVRPEDVDASVKEKGPDFVYAVSLQSAQPLMVKAISGK